MPIEKGTRKTETQRKAQNKYDRANFKVAACKIPISKYDQFQEYAKQRGKTVAGALAAYIEQCIAETIE